MPLPMVHLAVAREYAHDAPMLLECPEFYLGSIAPDAIHMRENTGRMDKDITHLRRERDLWKANIITFLKQHKGRPDYSFFLGYGIHSLTDMIWHETILKEFQAAYDKDPAPVQDKKWAYYNDTDKLDFELYRTCEWRPKVWELLKKAKPCDVDGLLSADEIEAWKNRTLHWFDSGESQHKNPIRYISIEDLFRFIHEAGVKIRSFLEAERI